MSINHRFTLHREWIGTGGRLNFIMLNPSTADDVFDDSTIRKCVGFAKRWGFSAIEVTNLFAFRATDPRDLRDMALNDYAQATGCGLGNDGYIIAAARTAQLIVCAWGTHGKLNARDRDLVYRVLPGSQLFCIRQNADGSPAHPCREPYTAQPIPFRMAA